MEMTRRAVLTVLAAPALVGLPAPAADDFMAYPHPNVGRPNQVKDGYIHISDDAVGTVAGIWQHFDGTFRDPGRFYTEAEWKLVSADVSAFLKARASRHHEARWGPGVWTMKPA